MKVRRIMNGSAEKRQLMKGRDGRQRKRVRRRRKKKARLGLIDEGKQKRDERGMERERKKRNRRRTERKKKREKTNSARQGKRNGIKKIMERRNEQGIMTRKEKIVKGKLKGCTEAKLMN